MITQIGSLPYSDVNQAIRYSLNHDIPFLPELPKLGDTMLDYIKEPGRLSCLPEFKKHRFSTVKIQCVGPATLIKAGYSQDDALLRIVEHLSAITDGLQARDVILFLDEPALGQVGFNLQELWRIIFENFDALPGIHCCGNMDWDILFGSRFVEFISFDASCFDITRYPGYRSRKRIAWGVESVNHVRDFQIGDLLTLPCGMGPKKYGLEDCEANLRKLKQIKDLLMNQ